MTQFKARVYNMRIVFEVDAEEGKPFSLGTILKSWQLRAGSSGRYVVAELGQGEWAEIDPVYASHRIVVEDLEASLLRASSPTKFDLCV